MTYDPYHSNTTSYTRNIYYSTETIRPYWVAPDQSAFEINQMPTGIFRWRYWDELRVCIAESQDFSGVSDCTDSIRWVAASDYLTVSYGTLSERRISAYLIYYDSYPAVYGWRLYDRSGRMFLQSPTRSADYSRCWANIAKLQKADNRMIEGVALSADNYLTRIEPKPVIYSTYII